MSTKATPSSRANGPTLQSTLEKHRRLVDVENYDITVGELVRMMKRKEIIRSPEYQRKFRWTKADESYLIESLFLGLPVPSIYVAANPDGSWEVVDGLQRLTTLLHFVSDENDPQDLERPSPLKLEGLQKLTDFNSLTHEDLPTPIQLYFSKRPLRITALSDKSDHEIRFEVFERLNKGGMTLTPQEVRACIYRGEFAELLRELALSDHLKSLIKLQTAYVNDGTKEELILKFFAYLHKSDCFKGDVKGFLNDYMLDAKTSFDITQGRTLANEVLEKLHNIHKGPILREGYAVTPLNQFEAIMVATGLLIESGKPIRKPKKGWLNDAILVEHSTKGTNSRKALEGRILRAKQLLSGSSVK
jgi:hypothetical protein